MPIHDLFYNTTITTPQDKTKSFALLFHPSNNALASSLTAFPLLHRIPNSCTNKTRTVFASPISHPNPRNLHQIDQLIWTKVLSGDT